MGIEIAGPLGLLILVFDIYAILNVARSQASSLVRVVWIALILIAPIIGFLLWLFLGPREERSLFRR
ncbi:PLDc N-terminal domain-containing protein [Hyphobacterium indicum]|uniref:PLDc N-terminal domain-containing protein n=1 Tax=Hyphobacterium indicum TaxID=2162714 RepID=UPI000D64E312|nr:PLDc N-terminal domain-containing protein [Hyphobacterium indicum]